MFEEVIPVEVEGNDSVDLEKDVLAKFDGPARAFA